MLGFLIFYAVKVFLSKHTDHNAIILTIFELLTLRNYETSTCIGIQLIKLNTVKDAKKQPCQSIKGPKNVSHKLFSICMSASPPSLFMIMQTTSSEANISSNAWCTFCWDATHVLLEGPFVIRLIMAQCVWTEPPMLWNPNNAPQMHLSFGGAGGDWMAGGLASAD